MNVYTGGFNYPSMDSHLIRHFQEKAPKNSYTGGYKYPSMDHPWMRHPQEKSYEAPTKNNDTKVS